MCSILAVARVRTLSHTASSSLAIQKRSSVLMQHRAKHYPVVAGYRRYIGSITTSSDVPLVFLHGMKGSHLAFKSNEEAENLSKKESRRVWDSWTNPMQRRQRRRQRAWLTLPALLNVPPRPDDYPARDLSLPLTYSNDDGVQDRGNLVVDGIVNHIVELGSRSNKTDTTITSSSASARLASRFQYFPFYGHVTDYLKQVNDRYGIIQQQQPSCDTTTTKALPSPQQQQPNNDSLLLHNRPTKSFCYDWRRSLLELSEEFYNFCETEFPNQPVQVLGHSLGGLIAFGCMRKYPEKYQPGGVLVGVPFGTGIQYLQDLHRGYFTELGTCRQFLPKVQFTFSSHWSFFPTNDMELGDTFMDVTDCPNVPFVKDKSAIGKPGTAFQDAIHGGHPVSIDFYSPDEWEQHELGIFDSRSSKLLDESTLQQYKHHMEIQLALAKQWRSAVHQTVDDDATTRIPPLVVCATNTIPTLNQILRRRKGEVWEYDYISGRSVPGDGRIDYDKAFPPQGTRYTKIALDSLHAKQLCWEESGGNLAQLFHQVTQQLETYHRYQKQKKHPQQQQQQQQARMTQSTTTISRTVRL